MVYIIQYTPNDRAYSQQNGSYVKYISDNSTLYELLIQTNTHTRQSYFLGIFVLKKALTHAYCRLHTLNKEVLQSFICKHSLRRVTPYEVGFFFKKKINHNSYVSIQ